MSLGILRLPLFAFFLFSRWLELFLVVVVQYVNDLFFVENNGFEPLTLCVQSRCSSQLS